MGARSIVASRTLKSPDQGAFRPTYADGFNMIASGADDAALLSALKITEAALPKLKAAYIALFPQEAAELFDLARTDEKYLVDECISQALVVGVSERYGLANHIDYLNMSGTKDPEVYEYALSCGYDAIFTRDLAHKEKLNPFNSQDLTTIAVAHAIESVFEELSSVPPEERKYARDTLPVLIRFKGFSGSDKAITTALDKYNSQIRFALEFRQSPYITISKGGVHFGPSYEDIFNEFFKPKRSKTASDFDRARIDAWTKSWTQKIIDNYAGKRLKKKDIKAIRKKVAKMALKCQLGDTALNWG